MTNEVDITATALSVDETAGKSRPRRDGVDAVAHGLRGSDRGIDASVEPGIGVGWRRSEPFRHIRFERPKPERLPPSQREVCHKAAVDGLERGVV